MAVKTRKGKKHCSLKTKEAVARTLIRNLALFHSQKAEGEYTAEVINEKLSTDNIESLITYKEAW